MSARPWEAPIYHLVLKHSRGALVSLPPASHTFSLRSLRNCAWNDMCERQAGGYSLETVFTFLVSRCDKGAVPLSHRLTVFIFSCFAFAGSNGGDAEVAANK